MKDAFGGTYMLYVVMIMLVIYISFMTVAIGYAKAFRIKNHVVSILEKPIYADNYNSICESHGGKCALDEIETYVSSVHYDYSSNSAVSNDCSNKRGSLESSVCIKKTEDSNGIFYYEVTSYFVIDAPFFNISLLVPIRGETKLINL